MFVYFTTVQTQDTLTLYEELIKQAFPINDIADLIRSKLTGKDDVDLTLLQSDNTID